MERNFERLPQALQSAVEELRHRLAEQMGTSLHATFADLAFDGKDHKVYYLPEKDETGAPRLNFGVLIPNDGSNSSRW